jgi:hypothetical protein
MKSRTWFALLLCALTSAASAATVNATFPTFTHDRSVNGLTIPANVVITGATGQAVVGFDARFTIVPQADAIGTLTPTGDWATEPSTSPVFAGQNPSQNAASPYLTSFALPAGSTPLNNNSNLVKLTFTASANALGNFNIVFDNGISDVLDDSFNDIATFNGGTITVAIPEPATFSLLLLGGLPLLARRHRR